MLKTTVEIHRFGNPNDASVLATILIANAGVSANYFHTYAVVIKEENPIVGDPIYVEGILRDYDRGQPVINLIGTVLDAYARKELSNPSTEYEKRLLKHLSEL